MQQVCCNGAIILPVTLSGERWQLVYDDPPPRTEACTLWFIHNNAQWPLRADGGTVAEHSLLLTMFRNRVTMRDKLSCSFWI